MRNRDERLLVVSAALLLILVAILTVSPGHHSNASPTRLDEEHFIGPGEGLASCLPAETRTGPTNLGRFWYSRRIDKPNQFFKAWVNWGDPRHQDNKDAERGFWAHLRLDLEHSADGKWCYDVENWDPATGTIIAAPVYGQAGSYVAYMKVWDAEKTSLKPNIEAKVTVQ